METFIQHQPIINWAKQALHAYGYNTKVDVELVLEAPWSCVIKLFNKKDCFYLKQCPVDLLIEAKVIQILRQSCNVTNIPSIIATNPALHCFLMTACGDQTLRTFFAGNLQSDLLINGITVYKSLQKATSTHIDKFIGSGVPDWRLQNFPTLYKNILLTSKILTIEQIAELQKLQSAFNDTCKKLSNFKILDCLNHSDFHDNNILIDNLTKEIAIIDLGEVTIGNPLLSLSTCLRTIADRYQLQPKDETYIKLKSAVFEDWDIANKDLPKILELIAKILPIYFILNELRLIQVCQDPSSIRIRSSDKISNAYNFFLSTMESNIQEEQRATTCC